MKRFLTTALAILLVLQVFAQQRWAVVEFSSNMMREEVGYDAELGNQALMGTVVKVLGHEDDWTLIESPEPYQAWVVNRGLVEMTEEEKNAYIAEPKLICTVEYTHVMSQTKADSDRICDLVMGDLVRSTGRAVLGWTEVILPSGQKGWVRSGYLEDFGKWASSRELTGENVIKMAKKFLGVPYMWGGTSIKHVDCSGLSSCTYRMLGVLLPRNASQQVKVGTEVPMDKLEKGDLLFFGRAASEGKPEKISHVAIYLGDGKIIHSSYIVRINSIVPEADDYCGRQPLHARRIIGNVDNGTGIYSIAHSPLYFKQ